MGFPPIQQPMQCSSVYNSMLALHERLSVLSSSWLMLAAAIEQLLLMSQRRMLAYKAWSGNSCRSADVPSVCQPSRLSTPTCRHTCGSPPTIMSPLSSRVWAPCAASRASCASSSASNAVTHCAAVLSTAGLGLTRTAADIVSSSLRRTCTDLSIYESKHTAQPACRRTLVPRSWP